MQLKGQEQIQKRDLSRHPVNCSTILYLLIFIKLKKSRTSFSDAGSLGSKEYALVLS